MKLSRDWRNVLTRGGSGKFYRYLPYTLIGTKIVAAPAAGVGKTMLLSVPGQNLSPHVNKNVLPYIETGFMYMSAPTTMTRFGV